MNEFAAQHPFLVVVVPKVVVLLFILLTALAYLTWFERKVVAHIQARWGPYRVGLAWVVGNAARGWREIPISRKTSLQPERINLHIFSRRFWRSRWRARLLR